METNKLIYTKDSLEVNEVLDIVKEFGLAIIPNYLTIDKNSELKEEFYKFLSTEDDKSKIETPYSNGQCARIKREFLDKKSYPTTNEVFGSNFMEDLKNSYLTKDCSLNDEIFAVKDVEGTKHIANDMHFDIIPTLKYFIYLTDTTSENGAFTCVPKSHLITQSIRKEKGNMISDKNREITRDLPFDEANVTPIEGKAGTMIIFTTETFHKAGIVSKGERLVMRGHCRAPKYFKKKSLVDRILNKVRS